MAWCPKCRNEYVEGITFCSSCNCDLVEQLEEIKELKYLNIKDYPNVDDLLDFLHKSGVESAQFCETEQDGIIIRCIAVSPDDYFDASIHMSVYFENESNISSDMNNESEEIDDDIEIAKCDTNDTLDDFNADTTEDEDKTNDSIDESAQNNNSEESPKISTYGNAVYVPYSVRYEEEKSSAYTLLFVGTLGGLILLLEALGVFTFPIAAETKWLFYIVFSAMMLGFFIYGFISYKKSSLLQAKATEENAVIDSINTWATNNLSTEEIDSNIETEIQEELLYFNRIEFIKDKIMHEFENADEPLVDSLLENIYISLFESNSEE